MCSYINGEALTSSPLNNVALKTGSSSPFTVGDIPQQCYQTQSAFRGHICEMRVWKTARTAAEVQEYMNLAWGGSTGAAAPDSDGLASLIGYWPMAEGLGTQVHDVSKFKGHGVAQGMAWVKVGVWVQEWVCVWHAHSLASGTLSCLGGTPRSHFHT